MNRNAVQLALAVLTGLVPSLAFCDWPQFRGPDGNGLLESIDHPLTWSAEENVAWTTRVPGSGWSSPIVVDGKIFVTTAISEEGENKPKDMAAGARDPRSIPFLTSPKPPENIFRYEVFCLDLQTGRVLWNHRAAESQPKIPVHPSNTFATESPAGDRKRVFAFFGTVGMLIALDHDGNRLWERQFEVYPMTSGLGTGSSLLLAGEILYLQRDNDTQSSLTAIDTTTGADVWSTTRESKTSWSTPFLWKLPTGDELIICGSGSVIAHDPQTGKERWRMGRITSSFSASPAANSERLFFGSSGPLSTSPLYAVNTSAAGDISLQGKDKSNASVDWFRTGSGPGMASLFVTEDEVYVPGDGILKVFDTRTGKELSKQRLRGAKIFVASPWGNREKLFLLDESGQTFVLKTGPIPETLHVNKIDDTFWSTPAVAGPNLLLRGVEGIYCIRH